MKFKSPSTCLVFQRKPYRSKFENVNEGKTGEKKNEERWKGERRKPFLTLGRISRTIKQITFRAFLANKTVESFVAFVFNFPAKDEIESAEWIKYASVPSRSDQPSKYLIKFLNSRGLNTCVVSTPRLKHRVSIWLRSSFNSCCYFSRI